MLMQLYTYVWTGICTGEVWMIVGSAVINGVACLTDDISSLTCQRDRMKWFLHFRTTWDQTLSRFEHFMPS